MQKKNLLFVIVLILSAAASRLLPHPPNFTPVGAMALFAGAVMGSRFISYLIPVLAMFMADLALNNIVYAEYSEGFVWFTEGAIWIYGGILAMVFLAPKLIKKISAKSIVLASLVGAAVFFLLSNFGVWLGGALYAKSLTGLIACYGAALPFFLNSILGNLVFGGAMFGIYHLVQTKVLAPTKG